MQCKVFMHVRTHLRMYFIYATEVQIRNAVKIKDLCLNILILTRIGKIVLR